MPRLDFYIDQKLFLKIKLGGGEALLGRGTDCQVQLPREHVSRRHAVIRPVGEQYEVENLSANGTRLNARMVESPTVLAAGDRIYIHDYVIIYQPDEATSEELEGERTLLA
jgi:pSer/pThr/pTyr-binding forkhead associated (FHA) protein